MSYLSQLAGNIVCLLEAGACFRSNIALDAHPAAKKRMAQGEPCIFVFWHHNIPIILYRFRDNGYIPMISLSGDAGLLIPTLKYFGYGFLRGSSTRGGLYVLKEGTSLLESGHSLAITPDGPVGPRYSFKAGAYILSQKTGTPIITVGAALYRKFVVGSWDGMEIPVPYAISSISLGEPHICTRDRKSEIRELKDRLHLVEAKAEKHLKSRLREIYR